MEITGDTIQSEVYQPTDHVCTFPPEIRLQAGKISVQLVNGAPSDAAWVLMRLQSLLLRIAKND